MTKDYNLARKIFSKIWNEDKNNWSGDTAMINSSSLFREVFYPILQKYLQSKKCNNCKFFNIKSDEYGICDNSKNEFRLRFNSFNKKDEILKTGVRIVDFGEEIKHYTIFCIHQDFGCANHCL